MVGIQQPDAVRYRPEGGPAVRADKVLRVGGFTAIAAKFGGFYRVGAALGASLVGGNGQFAAAVSAKLYHFAVPQPALVCLGERSEAIRRSFPKLPGES